MISETAFIIGVPIPHRRPRSLKHAHGQKLGTFFFRADPNTARQAGTLTRDEAHRMAADFAKLPELLKGDEQMESIQEAERLLRRLGRR